MKTTPLWKWVLTLTILMCGMLYSLPNFYGESPGLQLSSSQSTVKVDEVAIERAQKALSAASIVNEVEKIDQGARIRLTSVENQMRAKDILESEFDIGKSSFVVAMTMFSDSPSWLRSLGANPMFLGLDLRGGVHFLLQVDHAAAMKKKVDSMGADLRSWARDENIRHRGIAVRDRKVEIKVDESALNKIRNAFQDWTWSAQGDSIVGVLPEESIRKFNEMTIKQNIMTLSNRINELGVAEPVIQQQGLDRIVVQLPGVQDTAKAKDILGRTATLEIRMVEEDTTMWTGTPPPTHEFVEDFIGAPMLLKKHVVLTGERLVDAQAGFNPQTQEPVVNLTLDSVGARVFKEVTRANVGKRLAILLIEKGKAEVVTAPVIQTEIGGGRVQISGSMSVSEASDTALLLRAGSLAAPMDIIEERTIGPSLGAENIKKGFDATLWGFVAIAVFMTVYYRLIGVASVIALTANLMLLVALLSLLQATLTLPGIAAIALTLGMAIDANVLINERIREELREGLPLSSAISQGYDRAWATILDSNITTLIAGLALLIFGSGPVRGFAVVHCLGILTSIFSAVVISRVTVNTMVAGKKNFSPTMLVGTSNA